MRATELKEVHDYLCEFWAWKIESKIIKLEREGKEPVEYLLYRFVFGIFAREITVLKRLLNRYSNVETWIDGTGAGTELRIYIL